MITAAIIIDSWKLRIFKKVLDQAGFEYKKHKGPVPETLLLKVKTESAEKLKPYVAKANQEAARSKLH